MAEDPDIPLLDHELAEDELAWMKGVYDDFAKARAAFAGREADFNPKEALRAVLAQEKWRLPTPMDLTGNGPWRGGRNKHGRFVAGVFLPKVELHRHSKSRTDQFPMYVVGEAEGFALDDRGQPILIPVEGGGHFHNEPNAPHAFVPKVGQPIPDDWEIAFIAITPRNLKDDTQRVSNEVLAAFEKTVGRPAPVGV
jgi:hypothetical protein